MKKRVFRLLRYILLMSITLLSAVLLNPNVALAAETDLVSPILLIDGYSITDDKVVPGNEFTLSLDLKNYNDNADATDVWIDISCPNGVAPLYGTTAQIFLGDIVAGESKKISIEFEALKTVTLDLLDFYVSIRCNETSNVCMLRVPVGSDSPFKIVSSYIPTQVLQNDIVDVALNFYVLGEENVRNVSMTILFDGEAIAKSSIGIVTAGTTKTQNLSFYADLAGTHDVEIILDYTDDTGIIKEISAAKSKLVVIEKVTKQDEQGGTALEEENVVGGEWTGNPISKITLLRVSGILILMLCLVVAVVIRKNR